jgi:amino acid transporter
MPPALGLRHALHGTPVVSIAVVSVISAVLASLLDFDRLSDISNIALFCQYVPTCVSVIVMRRKRPDLTRAFRLPLGPLVPVLASLGCVLFLYGTKRDDVLFSLYILLGGLALYFAYRRLGRPAAAATGR